MFTGIENIEIVSTYRIVGKPYVETKCRNDSAFFIRIRGNKLYDFYDRKIIANEGDLVFVPKGVSFSSKTISGSSLYLAINFNADFLQTPQPARYSLDKFYETEFIINNFADLWNLGTQADKYQCMSLFYSMLSYLCSMEIDTDLENRKFKIIDPAVEYLKEHIYDSKLTTEKLHRLCGISNTYFRQIFLERFGTTPKNYILSKRISHAKAIITSGDFNTISEVALSIGFNDPLYFSKVFKKTYGVSPSDINMNKV